MPPSTRGVEVGVVVKDALGAEGVELRLHHKRLRPRVADDAPAESGPVSLGSPEGFSRERRCLPDLIAAPQELDALKAVVPPLLGRGWLVERQRVPQRAADQAALLGGVGVSHAGCGRASSTATTPSERAIRRQRRQGHPRTSTIQKATLGTAPSRLADHTRPTRGQGKEGGTVGGVYG
jgi:hypothetical protein